MYNFTWLDLFSDISLLINTVYVITILFIVLLIIFENRSPIKSISWILVVTLIPVLGILFYFFFGQRYRKKMIVSLRVARFRKKVKSLSELQLTQLSKLNPSDVDIKLAEKKDIMSLLLRNDHAFLSRNKKVTLLNNGSETYSELKKALKSAKDHIHMEFYAFNFDGIGTEIFEILKEKASMGVEVRIIYDGVGSQKVPHRIKKEAHRVGIEMKSFQKVYLPFLSSRVNYRNHRKIVVIDSNIGFTGGLNIADRYIENEQKYWRDTFVRIDGKSVSALQSIFINDWFYVSKQNIYHDKYFNDEEAKTGTLTQIISSGPDSDWHAISQFYFSAITSSRDKVYITSPYFIPNDEISFAIKAAALRGIDVRIMIPEKSDSTISHWSSESYVAEMLKSGVKMYQYTKGFCHSKLLVSDDVLCSIGSANLDYRSLETNFEVCAIFYDEKLTNTLTKQFMVDLKNARQIDLRQWKKRKWYKKLASSFSRLFAPLM